MDKNDLKQIQLTSGEVPESRNYIEIKADSALAVGTNNDGEELLTFLFLNNYPIVKNENGSISVSNIEKRKLASVTLGMNQAKKFYESLKSIFEPE